MLQASTLTQSAAPATLAGHMRKMKLTEFDRMIDLGEVAFAEDQAREGRSMRDELKGIQSMVPVLRFLFKINPSMEDHFYTLVWEVDQKFVAGVTVSQQGGDKTRWYIANVATHPDFRGKGLARKLVSAGIDHIRERGGQRALLQVRSDNTPAYQLYRSLGFAQLESETILKGQPVTRSIAPLPAGYTLRVLSDKDWQPLYALAARLASPEMQTVSPISEQQFHMSGFTRALGNFINRAQGRTFRRFLIERDGQAVAYAECAAQKGNNPHRLTLTIDPVHQAVAPHLIDQGINFCLDRIASPILVTLDSHLAAPIDQLRSIGFEEIETAHTLGLKL